MPTDLAALNRRFSIPGFAYFEVGQNGLLRAVLTAAGAEGHVYLHGAHVTHYRRDGEPPVLWVSGQSWFEDGKPIRGGVPVIFPWFGARKDAPPAGAPAALAAPGHGFVRLREWEVESVTRQGDAVEIALVAGSDAQTRATWPHDFGLRFRASVGHELRMTLEVRNTGRDAFTFEEALHTYIAVGDIRRASVTGLDGAAYLDKAPGNPGGADKRQHGPIRFEGETDRVYPGTRATCVIDDPAQGRRIAVEKSNSDATVVWNPWAAKAKAMPDFGDDEWPGMLCVETCNVGPHAVTLAPGATHAMTATVQS